MKKKFLLWILLDVIFLIIFNTIFFIAGGFEHGASVWISYGFIHFAYLILLITPALVRKGKSASVFGFSLGSVSSVYFITEFIVGVIFIWTKPDGYKAALLVQLCIAGLYGIALISNLIANEHTADVEEKRAYQIDYVKKASAELKGILDIVSGKDEKKQIERVYDAIYSSPVRSHQSLASMESQILISINELRNAVSGGDKDVIISLADSLLIAVNERNRQLNMLN